MIWFYLIVCYLISFYSIQFYLWYRKLSIRWLPSFSMNFVICTNRNGDYQSLSILPFVFGIFNIPTFFVWNDYLFNYFSFYLNPYNFIKFYFIIISTFLSYFLYSILPYFSRFIFVFLYFIHFHPLLYESIYLCYFIYFLKLNTSLAAPGALTHRMQCGSACKIQNGHLRATWGPQNGRRGLERCLPLRFCALPSTFNK